MTQKKVNAEAALEQVRIRIQLEEEQKERNILGAIQDMKEDFSPEEVRGLFFEMSLKFTADQKNGVDDFEMLKMMSIFEVLNVL
jgi:hypothetical protein